MAMAKTVVAGEASESDDDEETMPTKLQKTAPKSVASRPTALGVVVSGEASESDEEEDKESTKAISSITPLKIDPEREGDNSVLAASSPVTSPRREVPLKFDTLLHKKLHEKNIALHNHIQSLIAHEYVSSAKDLHTMAGQMTKSQIAVQDASHKLQLLTNDLFHLEDKVDIIATCRILPVINISQPTPPSSASSSPRTSPLR